MAKSGPWDMQKCEKGCFGATESVRPEDKQTSQAKENLKVVTAVDTAECKFLSLC